MDRHRLIVVSIASPTNIDGRAINSFARRQWMDVFMMPWWGRRREGMP